LSAATVAENDFDEVAVMKATCALAAAGDDAVEAGALAALLGGALDELLDCLLDEPPQAATPSATRATPASRPTALGLTLVVA
jgi:phosphosulfolactate phosphohydrolase-like enzyme